MAKLQEMTMQPKNKIMRITGTLNNNQPFIVQVPDNTEIVADITERAQEQSVLKV